MQPQIKFRLPTALTACVCIVSVFLPQPARGQDPIEIQIDVMQPVPPYIEGWRDQIVVTLRVSPTAAQDAIDVVLLGQAEHLSRSDVFIRTTRPSTPITVERGFDYTLSGSEIGELFDPDQIESGGGLNPEEISLSDRGLRVPEGNYHICIQALDAVTAAITLGEECSVPFTVRYVDPPRLILPENDATLSAVEGGDLVPPFQWENYETFGVPLDYEFRMVEVPEGVLPNDALRDGSLFEFRSDEISPFIFAPDDHVSFPMTSGRRYAWQVIATDPSGTVYISSDGASEVRSFTYGALDTELAVLADVGDISFSPAQPDRTIPVRVRMFASGSAGTTIAILQSVRVMILDGMRIVYASEDAPMEALPVSFVTWVEADVNVSLPPSVIDEILGSRDASRFTMQIHVNADPSAGGDPITGFDEFDVDIVRADLVATMTRPTAMPVLTDRSHPAVPVQFRFNNVTGSDVVLSRLQQVWRFDGVPEFRMDDVITDSGSRTITVPARSSTFFDATTNLPPERIRDYYAANGRPGVDRGTVTVTYTFTTASGAVSVPVTPSLEMTWSAETVVDTLSVVVSGPVQPHRYNRQFDGPTVAFTFTNSGSEDITLRSWSRWLYDSGGTLVGMIDQALPEPIFVQAGFSPVWAYNETVGSGLHRQMREQSGSGPGPAAYRILYRFEGTQASGNRHRADVDPRVDVTFAPNALSVRLRDMGDGSLEAADMPFTFSDTVAAAMIELTNHTTGPLHVTGYRASIKSGVGGAVLHTLATKSLDITVEPGSPFSTDEWFLIPSSVQAVLIAGVAEGSSRTFVYAAGFEFENPVTEVPGLSPVEFEVTVGGDRDGVVVTAITPGGFPLHVGTGQTSWPFTYEFVNHREYEVTLRSVQMALLDASGSTLIESDRVAISDDFTIAPRSGTRTFSYGYGFEDEVSFARIRTDGSLTGQTLTGRVRFEATDARGTIYPAVATFDVDFVDVLTVEASAPGGFPIELARGEERIPLDFRLVNTGDSDITISFVQTRTFDRSGAEMSELLLTPEILVPAGGSTTESVSFGMTVEAVERRRLDSGSEVFRAVYSFSGRDGGGALREAEAEFNFLILSSELEVRVSTEDGFPLQFPPGIDRRDVTYEVRNRSDRSLTVTWFGTVVRELDGAVVQTLPRRPLGGDGAFTLAAGESHAVDIPFGFSDAGWPAVRAGGDRRLEVEVTFTASDSAGVEVPGSVKYDAQIRLSPLRVTAEAPWGFPLTLYAGSDRAEITYTYHNDGDADLEITGVAQRVTERDGSGGGTASPSAFPRPITVSAGGSVSDLRFFGLGPGALATFRGEIPTGEFIRRLRAELTFTARNSSGSEFTTPYEFDLNVSNSVLRARAHVPGGPPLRFDPGESRSAIIYEFQNFDTADHNFAQITQTIVDDRGDQVHPPTPAVRRPAPLLIPAAGSVRDSASVPLPSTLLDVARMTGRDKSFTYLAQFAETEGGAPFAEVDVPILVASSALGQPFVAGSPADGEAVRGPVRFEIQARDTLDLDRVSSIHMQIYRVPAGESDATAAMVVSNRVAERTFANSSASRQIRWVGSSKRLVLLATRGSSPGDDVHYEFNGVDDADYAWSAEISFSSAADGSTGSSTEDMEPGRFTTREPIAECGAECTLTAPTGSGQTSRLAISYVGTTVRIGAFDLEITTASGNGADLDGEGHIDVPYLRAPIAVEFENLSINSANQVTSGEAKAKTDRPDILTPDYTDRVTEMAESMSITDSQAEDFQAIAELIESTGRIVSAFTSSREPVQLPLGIDQHIDGEFLLLAIIGIKFKPTGARVNAVLSVPLPELDTRLSIGARGICLTAAGFDEEITFYLASDLFLTMSELSADSDDYTIRFKAGTSDSEGTYLRWRCESMEVLRIEMWHEFPRSWISPVDPSTGEVVADSSVKSTAKLVVDIRPISSGGSSGSGSGSSGGGSSGGGSGSGSGGGGSGSGSDSTVTAATGLQWIAGVREFTPSAIADANGFWFSVENMYYDNSSLANPIGMTYPAGYPSALQNNRWTGFYLGLVRLNLPDEIRSFGEDDNIELQVRHVLIDNTGLNFTFTVRNLLTLKSDSAATASADTECVARLEGGTDSCVGDMAGWQFSVDELSISVLHSSFGTAALRGEFKIPISDTALAYSATLVRPASLRMGDGSETSSDPGTGAARAFGLECADLLANRPPSGSSGGSGGSGSGSGGGGGSGSASSSAAAPDLIFEMLVSPVSDIKADLWGAELTIASSSKICIGNQTGELRAGIELNGRFGLGDDLELPAEITGVPFERIRVMTFAPYFEAPDFARTPRTGSTDPSSDTDPAADSHSSSGEGLALDISNIGLEFGVESAAEGGRTGINVGIGFDVSLQLPGDGVFRASARDIIVWGQIRLATEDEPADFQFIGFLTVPTFCVGGDAEALKIDGCIEIYIDRPDARTPGATDSGVAGAINVVIAGQIQVRVAAEFGVRSLPDRQFEYFFVDAAVTFASGINIGGAVALYGILGGVWYNMTGPSAFTDSASSDFGTVLSAPASTEEPSVEGVLAKYRPVSADAEGTWGFKAGLVLGVAGNSEAFNIDVFIEAQISGGGDLDYIRLVGDAYVMTKLDDRSDPKIRGTLVIELAFRPTPRADGSIYRAPVFDASFRLMGNLADILILEGEAGLHIEEAYWQFYIGRPERRFSVRLTLGGADLLRFGTYIMMGDRLPPFPPPPEGAPRVEAFEVNRIRDIAGGEDGTDERGEPRKEISGFMMGADLRIEPSIDLGIIGIDGYFQLGFDVAITTSVTFCLNEATMTTFRRGDGGWYIEGRMYAMMGIKLWTRILFGVKATIARLDAGILLEGGFPNPEYFAGAADISGELLGAIRFDEHVEFVIGQVCLPAPRSPLEGVELITDLRPTDAAPHYDRDVSPFADPTAAYFLDLNRTLTITDETDRRRYFRLKSDGVDITDAETGATVECYNTIRGSGAYQVCEPVIPGTRTPSFLEPETGFNIAVEVIAEERSSSGWNQALTLEGDAIEESRSASFRTGCLPTELDGLILQTYPVNGQRYFLQGETNFGFVDVAVNVDYLRRSRRECGSDADVDVSELASSGYAFVVRLTPFPTGDPIDVDAYMIGQRFIYTIPPLESEKVYAAQLIRRTPESLRTPDPFRMLEHEMGSSIAPRLSEEQLTRLTESFERSGPAMIRRRVINAFSTTRPNEQRLYHWVFRTSRFSTLEEKMATATFGTPVYRRAFAFFLEVNTLRVPLTVAEKFDDVDIYGRDYEVNMSDYTESGVRLGRGRAAVAVTTNPLLFFGWRSSRDRYLRYAAEHVYPGLNLLERYGSIVRYPPSRGAPNGRESVPLVFLSTTQRQPLLPDDPEALTGMLARQSSTTSTRTGVRGTLGLIARTSTRTSLGFGGGLILRPGILTSVTPAYRLEYNVGTAVSADWVMMRTYGPRLVARRPQYCTERFGGRCTRYAPVDLRLLQRQMFLPFQRYSRGTYPVEFQYYPFIVDEFNPGRSTRASFVKTFRY